MRARTISLDGALSLVWGQGSCDVWVWGFFLATPDRWFGGRVVPADVYQNRIWQCLEEISPLKLQYDDDVHIG